MLSRAACLSCALVLPIFAGCEGLIADGVEPEPRPVGPKPVLVASEDPGLRRLTDRQFRNTLRDTLEALAGSPLSTNDVNRALGTLDSPHELDNRVLGATPFASYARAAISASDALVNRGSFRSEIMGGADAAEDRMRFEAWMREKGHLVYRRPLTSEEITFYTEEVADFPMTEQRLREVLVAMFLAPAFIYRAEFGKVDGQDGELLELTDYELANRLALFLWRSVPDDALWEAARAGSLRSELEGQVVRMLESPKADQFFETLLFEWLGLKEERMDFGPVCRLGELQAALHQGTFELDGVSIPATFAEREQRIRALCDFLTGSRLTNLFETEGAFEDAAMADMVAYLRYLVVNQRGTLEDLFTQEVSTAIDARVANAYGVAPWDGESDPPVHPSGRGGILGRVGFLMDAAEKTHPILRGLAIRDHVLCQPLPPPPMDFTFLAPPDPPFTTRSVVDYTTGADAVDGEGNPAGCYNCHQLTNGLGFAFEQYDIFGRQRANEFFFSEATPGGFLEGTTVHTESGLRPIESIQVGDRVWARTVREATPSLQTVVSTGVSDNLQFFTVTVTAPIGSVSVRVAENQLVELAEDRSRRVIQISAGSELPIRDADPSPIASISPRDSDDRRTTYSIRLAGGYSPFVGEAGIWFGRSEAQRWTLPVDDGGAIPGLNPANRSRVENPAELARMIVDYRAEGQSDAYDCFASHLIDSAFDGAVASEETQRGVVGALREGSTIDAIQALVTSRSFGVRDLGDQQEAD